MIAPTATISACGLYRYTLTRHIPCILRWVHPCLFLMLNPSVADASNDDPTIRRCMGFAATWQCTGLTVVNLFAYRATNPKALWDIADPVGPENDHHLREQLEAHKLGIIVAAWGSHDMAKPRARQLAPLLDNYAVKHISINKDGSPKHPLYVKANAPLTPFKVAA